jgi:hypothetical protein
MVKFNKSGVGVVTNFESNGYNFESYIGNGHYGRKNVSLSLLKIDGELQRGGIQIAHGNRY